MSPSSKLSFASKHLSGGSGSRLRLTSMLALLNGRGSVAFRTGKSGFKVRINIQINFYFIELPNNIIIHFIYIIGT